MKRSTNFLIAFAVAAVTFGTLQITIGPKQWAWRGHGHYAYGSHENHYRCINEGKKSTNDEEKGQESGKENSTDDY